MSCDPHPQVVSPCADDAVSVANVLGTRGDVSFDETGSVALTAGQTSAEITFGYQKESSDYRFEYLYVKTLDGNPADVRPVPNSQTQRGFTVALTGEPITANSKLYWRVVVPDALHTCQGVQGSPAYAIVRPHQNGIASFPQGQNFVAVIFPEAMPDNDWGFDQLTIEHAGLDILGFVQVFPFPTVVVHTTLGFTLEFGSAPTSIGYTLRWRVS